MTREILTKAQDSILPQQLGQMATGYWVSQALRCAVLLNVADCLQEKNQSAEELAVALKVKSEPLYRLLRALASVGVFQEQSDRRFSLTPLAQLLRSDHPQSQRNFVLMITGFGYKAWGELLYSIETEQAAFNKVYGQPLFEYLAQNSEEGKIFDAAMTGIHGGETQLMIDAYDFSAFKTVADVGGGNGSTLSGILNHVSHLNGILFDMPSVVERVKPHFAKSGLGSRIRLEGGDFFKIIPSADAYVLRHIVHDWSDEQASLILRNCAKAMNKGGKF
jgi:hypothetical protein